MTCFLSPLPVNRLKLHRGVFFCEYQHIHHGICFSLEYRLGILHPCTIGPCCKSFGFTENQFHGSPVVGDRYRTRILVALKLFRLLRNEPSLALFRLHVQSSEYLGRLECF